jgi:hypothetical protein
VAGLPLGLWFKCTFSSSSTSVFLFPPFFLFSPSLFPKSRRGRLADQIERTVSLTLPRTLNTNSGIHPPSERMGRSNSTQTRRYALMEGPAHPITVWSKYGLVVGSLSSNGYNLATRVLSRLQTVCPFSSLPYFPSSLRYPVYNYAPSQPGISRPLIAIRSCL